MNEGATIAQFFEFWELFREPTLAGMYAGIMLGMLGVYVVSRRMVFVAATVAQMSGLGVVLAFALPVILASPGVAGGATAVILSVFRPFLATPALGATVLALASCWAFIGVRRDKADHLLGVLFLLGSGGTLVLATRAVEELHDVQSLLFGTAVAVPPEDAAHLKMLCIVVVLSQLFLARGFLSVGFDRNDAKVRGLPVLALDLLLLGSLAIAIASTTRVLGSLPAFAFSVLPALAAVRLCPNAASSLVVAGVLGGATAFGGYIAAFLWDLPVGAAQTVLGVFVLLVAQLLGACVGFVRARFTTRERSQSPGA